MSYFSEFTVNTKKFINRHKNGLTKVVSTLLLLLLLPATTVLAISAEDQAKLDQIAAENSALKEKLNALYAQENTLENEIAIAEAQAAGLQAQINSTQTRINVANSQIAETEANIATAEANLVRQNEILKEYLKVIYMEGQTSEMELILTSNSFSEFVDQTEYLNNIQQSVSTTIDEITATKAKLEADKLALETTKAELVSLRAGQVAQQAALNQQINYKNALIASNAATQDDLQSQIAKNNADSAIIRCLAAGTCGSSANGDLVVVNSVAPYYAQTMYEKSVTYDSRATNYSGNKSSYYYYGCLVTSLAMAHGLTPAQEAINHTYSMSSYRDGYGNWHYYYGLMNSDSTSGTSINWATANSILAQGGKVVMGVDLDGNGTTDHFILAVGYSGGKYLINDPFPGLASSYDSSQVKKLLRP